MSELVDVRPEMISELNGFFKAENSRSADYSFGNVYMWDERFRQSVAVCGDRLVTLLYRKDEPYFAFPIGSGDLGPAFSFMRDYCRKSSVPLRLCGVEDKQLELILSAFPDEFDVAPDRDYSDYIYSVGKLATYAGKHLHSKRNFCHRFEAEHDWSFVPLSRELIPDCLNMLDRWTEQSSERLSSDIGYEHSAILRGLEHMELLGLEGNVLYADGMIAGFTVGEKIASDTYCTHFEKAFPDIDGAYPVLCRETAKYLLREHPEVCYVNREDDMGNPALRKSKLSYYPEFILMKYILSEKQYVLQR